MSIKRKFNLYIQNPNFTPKTSKRVSGGLGGMAAAVGLPAVVVVAKEDRKCKGVSRGGER